MILKGEKTEEYREIKPYWIKRLYGHWGKRDNIPKREKEAYETKSDGLNNWLLRYHEIKLNEYNLVEFTNGYGKDKPQITLECKGIEVGKGKPKWGAPHEDVFIIKLGKEVSRSNL